MFGVTVPHPECCMTPSPFTPSYHPKKARTSNHALVAAAPHCWSPQRTLLAQLLTPQRAAHQASPFQDHPCQDFSFSFPPLLPPLHQVLLDRLQHTPNVQQNAKPDIHRMLLASALPNNSRGAGRAARAKKDSDVKERRMWVLYQRSL